MPKKILVLDTTVCIDLFNGGLLEKALQLPYDLVLPDVIIEELINPPGEELVKIGYSVLPLGKEGVEQVLALRARYRKPSTNDLFALVLAKLNSCPLVTGDDSLRRAAKDEGLQVYGSLWVLDRLIDHHILSSLEAAVSLEKILEKGGWLPRKECEARLKRWRG
ncbi:MAG: PIN domain-containing protein [Thermodesulfobacteriota bacterium]